MTATDTPMRTLRATPRAMWLAVLALLVAVQSVSGGHWSPDRADAGQRVLRIAPAAPSTVLVRDAGKVVHASSRFTSPQLRRADGDTGPPLLASAIALATAAWHGRMTPVSIIAAAPSVDRPADRYRARAPPLAD